MPGALALLLLAAPAAGLRGLEDAWALLQAGAQAQTGRAGRGGLVYHLHIPRTGGTSFLNDARNILDPSDVVSREGCFSWRDELPQVRRVAFLLRSPWEHVLSQYLYCSEGPISWMTQTPRPRKFGEWVGEWAEQQAQGKIVGDFSKDHNAELELAFQRYVTFTSLPFHCYSPANLQTQHLTCQRPFKYPAEPDVELAITNMQESWFVGLVEAYQESLCLFHVKALGRLPGFCDCTNATGWASFRQSHTSYHRNATRTSRDISDQPKEALEALESLTRADRMLYKAAVQRFVFEVHEAEERFRTKILCDETLYLRSRLRDPMRKHFAVFVNAARQQLR